MDVKNEHGGPRRSSPKDAEPVVAAHHFSHGPLAESGTSHGGRLRFVLLLGSLVALGPLTTDMYLPALPAITSELHTSPAAVQLTLTGALAGLALGQLLVGPLSDAIGRRTPLLAGVSVHIIASVLCLLAPNLAVLDVLRVLQGFGAATSTVITMAIVRDLFEGAAAAGLLSRLMLILGVSPILAPTLGGIVLARTSWRGIFAVLAVLSLVITAATAIALPETLPTGRRRTGGLSSTFRDFTRLLRDRTFVGLIVLAGLAMSTIFAFVSGSPFVFQGHFGMSEQEFGYAFGAGALGLVLATQLNVRWLRHRSPSQVLTRSLAAAAVAGGLLLTCAAAGFGGMAGSLVPLWLVLFTVGFTLPNAAALALFPPRRSRRHGRGPAGRPAVRHRSGHRSTRRSDRHRTGRHGVGHRRHPRHRGRDPRRRRTPVATDRARPPVTLLARPAYGLDQGRAHRRHRRGYFCKPRALSVASG